MGLVPLGWPSYLSAAPALPGLAVVLLSAPKAGAGIHNLLMSTCSPGRGGGTRARVYE